MCSLDLILNASLRADIVASLWSRSRVPETQKVGNGVARRSPRFPGLAPAPTAVVVTLRGVELQEQRSLSSSGIPCSFLINGVLFRRRERSVQCLGRPQLVVLMALGPQRSLCRVWELEGGQESEGSVRADPASASFSLMHSLFLCFGLGDRNQG